MINLNLDPLPLGTNGSLTTDNLLLTISNVFLKK